MHPIVEQLSPSQEQIPAITSRGCDVVVTAGAGTGKTRTLVARYLSLLSEDMPLRSIVAITFTKKAAREMRNRLREAMREYLIQPDLPEAQRRFWQQRYSELDAARVSTIHSLCTEILRAHPAEAGVDPRFDVLDEGLINILREEVVNEGLAWAAETQAVVRLFEILGESDLYDTLSTLLRQRLEADDVLANLPEDLLAHWQHALVERQLAARAALLDSEPWQKSIAVLQANAPTNKEDLMAIQRQLVLTALDETKGSLSDLDLLNFKGGSKNNWPGGKEQLAEIKAALKTLRVLWQENRGILTLQLSEQDQHVAEAIPLLRQLFDYSRQRYRAYKAERTALDFDDLEDKAVTLLATHDAVRTRWQREVKALLVDEFQDTNARQRDLLGYLNGGQGKLFIVGDAKQSIYRFRGADVAVFRNKRDEIKTNGGKHIPLDTSYRAHKELINGMNGLLAPVLGHTSDPARPWLEPFSALEYDRVYAGQGFVVPHIELHLTVGTKGEGALQRAACMLVNRLIVLMEEQETLVGVGDKARPLTYGDIAILCRASTSFGDYEDALEQAGVPFLTVAGRGFYERPEIRDLLNALQAIADPTDDLALAGLLRSPALALSDEALYHLQQAHQEGEALSLWETLSDLPAALTAEDARRGHRALPIIQALHQQVGRIPVADLLKQFLDTTDYRAALIRTNQKRSARNVAKLLADANASELVSVGEFLAYVNGLRDSGAREGEARTVAEGAIQLMTIHAAKGLEFPIVAIGDMTYSSPSRNQVLLDPDLGVLLPLKDEEEELPAAYQLARWLDRDQEDAESRRLLYVAATRAQEKLLLSANIGLKDDGTLRKLSGWLGDIGHTDNLGLIDAEISYAEVGNKAIELALEVGETPVGCTVYEPEYEARTSIHTSPVQVEQPTIPLPPPLLSSLTQDKAALATDLPQRVWRVVPTTTRPHAPAWVVGDLVHKSLAVWRFPENGSDAWLTAQARNYGLIDEQQVKDAVQQSSRILHRFQSHPLHRQMSQATQCLHEVPYSYIVEGILETGIIDALFLANGDWTVVEFKTDDVRNDKEQAQLLRHTDYVAQIQRYQDVIRQMLGQDPKVLLCWLNCAGQVNEQTNLLEIEVG